MVDMSNVRVDLPLPKIIRGDYRVINNGNENYVLEWLNADGSMKGTARPATPQEYEMFASLDVLMVTLRNVMDSNDELRKQNEDLAESNLKSQARTRTALAHAGRIAMVEPYQRAERLGQIIAEINAADRKALGQDA